MLLKVGKLGDAGPIQYDGDIWYASWASCLNSLAIDFFHPEALGLARRREIASSFLFSHFVEEKIPPSRLFRKRGYSFSQQVFFWPIASLILAGKNPVPSTECTKCGKENTGP
jgi:hypothetical protein